MDIILTMKIFFTTPYAGKKKYQKYIDAIIQEVESNGATVTSPEKTGQYKKATGKEKIQEYGSKGHAHYEFIRHGIASADAVIFEASYEDFRVGHEATLALMYGKPTLVLSRIQDYSKYIVHERFIGKKYSNLDDLKKYIDDFLKSISKQLEDEPSQAVDEVVDLQHSSALSRLRFKALQGKSYFSDWARRASSDPDKVYEEILKKLGNLPIQQPWDVFAKIYNEDTPDNVFIGAVKFADIVFRANGVGKADQIADAACGTGAISRILTSFGYRTLISFDRSRPMLGEAYRLCSHLPSIKILEADISSVDLPRPAKGMIWIDFSSNFALEEKELKQWLTNLVSNLDTDGVLMFDVRTKTGWNIDFFKQKVTAYETDRFQRLWINKPDYKNQRITFDIFIRVRDKDGEWLTWEREQMTERMWSLDEVGAVVRKLKGVKLLGVYRDDFAPLGSSKEEPGLAYLVLKKE